jgi:hypothetical protein
MLTGCTAANFITSDEKTLPNRIAAGCAAGCRQYRFDSVAARRLT